METINEFEAMVETQENAELPEEKPQLEIQRSRRLRGTISFSGDAHQSVFALGIAALGSEPTRLENLPNTPWFRSYRMVLEGWGVKFEPVPGSEGHWLISSPQGLQPNACAINVKHEIAALVLTGIGAGSKLNPIFEWDPISIPNDVVTLLNALYPIEAGKVNAKSNTFNPTMLHRKAKNVCKPQEQKWNEFWTKIVLVFHHLAAGESLELQVIRSGSDLLENMLKHFEIDLKVERDDGKEVDELTRRIARQLRAAGQQDPVTRISLPANTKPKGAFISLAGDVGEASVAALAATVIKGSDILLENVLLNTGRAGFFASLRRMGADVEVVQRRERNGEAMGTWRVRSSDLMGKRFDSAVLSECREEVFLLLLAATLAEGESVFRDLKYLRSEVDWLKEFIGSLKKVAVEIGEIEDGLVIRGKTECDGGTYDSFGHAGLAAAYAVLGLKAHGSSTLQGFSALEFRYPGLLGKIEGLAAAEKA